MKNTSDSVNRRAKDLCNKRVGNVVGKTFRKYTQYFLHLLLFSLRAFLRTVFFLRVLLYLTCICCILYVFIVPHVYLLYYLCVAVLTSDAGLLARSQYPEGPATGHLDTGFSWFPCFYKRMLRWFPSFQVATTYLSCSPPHLKFLVTFFFPYLCTCNITTATG
jgi:hypothetical protein